MGDKARHSFTVVEVHQHTEDHTSGPSFNTLTKAVAEHWDFTPYPSCSLTQLRRVHTYFVAVSDRRRVVATSDGADPVNNTIDDRHDVDLLVEPIAADRQEAGWSWEESIMGVVGVVWVALSSIARKRLRSEALHPSAPSLHGRVEGYLQVVLVPSQYRGRGVGSRLLETCLQRKDTVSMLGNSKYANCRIDRWRLHTMLGTRDTESYLIDEFTLFCREEFPQKDESELQRHVAEFSAAALSLMSSVVARYSKLGFSERRRLYGYYSRRADAVEMVRIPNHFSGNRVQTA